MIYQYRSPLRPLDIGYAARRAGVEVDWDNTDIGAMYPSEVKIRRYAFTAELPADLVAALELERTDAR